MSTPKRFRFTNQLIKSLPPNTSDARSTDAEYSDTEISGLKCLVSRREGRKKFLLRYLYHGRKRAIAIGHWPEVDVNLARQIAIEHKRSLATGTDPKQERENKRMELTFDELFNQHYLPWAKSAKRSWGKDVQRYRDHIRPAIGQRLLSDITPASILRLQQTLSTSLSAATCNRVIVLIKAVFTWAGRQSMTSVHPARVVQLLRENNARQRYFTEDEIRRIFLSADNDTSPVAARYVKLLLLTGLRRDELRLAKWEHVDPVKRTLWLPETKNGYGRIVHLNSLAMDVIRTLPTQRGNVLPLSRSFTQLLLGIVAQKPPHRHPITGLTINFRDPEYSPEKGGWHPVEIRLIPAGEDWQLDYVTDFHYAGHPWPELEKDVDVSWTQQYTWLSRCGDISHVDAREFWSLWESNFMAYHDMGVFTVRTLWES
ncbi:DUF2787 family protein [Escherichia coli O79:H4]